MGYRTEFIGTLFFKHPLSPEKKDKLIEILNKEHEYSEKNKFRLLNLIINDSYDGLIWMDAANSYYMVDEINFILDKMQEEFPDFGLVGKFFAQGDAVGDHWFIVFENNRAVAKKAVVTFEEKECPNCGTIIDIVDEI